MTELPAKHQAEYMRVSVVSRINHGIYIAEALRDRGLRQYLGPVLVSENSARAAKRGAIDLSSRTAPLLNGLPYRPLLATDIVTQAAYRSPLSSWKRHVVSARTLDFEASFLLRGHDVLHHHSNCFDKLITRSRRMGAYRVCEHRAMHPDLEHPAGSPLHGILLRELEDADHLIVPSQAAKQSFVVRGYPEDQLSVIRLGTTIARRGEPVGSPEVARTTDVLFVGAVAARKDVEDLAKAMALSNSTALLRIVGPVVDPSIPASIRRSYGNVLFEGPKSAKVVRTHMASAKVLVLPSHFESFGLVVAEAMAQRTPVLVSDGCGIAELISDGHDGFTFRASDVDHLSEQLDRIDDMSEREAQTLAWRGRSRIEQQTWDRYVADLRDFYAKTVWAE